jgi:ubiquinone/menaquinone biosynthesis C-methylase UbiE
LNSVPHIAADWSPSTADHALSKTYSAPVSVAAGYERWAPTYDLVPNPLLAREERYLTRLLPSLSNKWVLDLACGTGRWLEKLVQRGAKSAVGIDCSPAMLREARKKSAIAWQLAAANCLSLPFRTSSFDLATCSFALGHITDLQSATRELARVMKFRADVFVSDIHPEAHAQGWRTGFHDAFGRAHIEISPRTAEEIIRTFHSAGFECLAHVPLCLGEGEKPLFERTGKIDFFARACQVPAVLVCHFRRVAASPSPTRSAL